MEHELEIEEFDCERNDDVVAMVKHLVNFHEELTSKTIDQLVDAEIARKAG